MSSWKRVVKSVIEGTHRDCSTRTTSLTSTILLSLGKINNTRQLDVVLGSGGRAWLILSGVVLKPAGLVCEDHIVLIEIRNIHISRIDFWITFKPLFSVAAIDGDVGNDAVVNDAALLDTSVTTGLRRYSPTPRPTKYNGRIYPHHTCLAIQWQLLGNRTMDSHGMILQVHLISQLQIAYRILTRGLIS